MAGSGNVCMGLPSSPSLWLDIAVKARYGPSAFMTATAVDACAPQAVPRVPSARPIDRRWDKSRGIVFSTTTRPIRHDQARSSANGFDIPRTLCDRRSYAVRSLDRIGSANQKSLEDMQDARPISDSQTWSPREVQYLKRDKTELAAKLNAAQAENKLLQAKLQQQNIRYRRVNEQLETLNASRDAETQKFRQMLVDEKAKIQKELDRVQAEARPGIVEIEKRMALERKRAYEQGARKAQQESEQKAREALYSSKKQSEQEIIDMEARHALAIKRQEESSIRRFDEVSRGLKNSELRNKDLQRQLDGRMQRQEQDRKHYPAYRDVYIGMHEANAAFLKHVDEVKYLLDNENRLWDRSIKAFQESNAYHRIGRYPKLRQAVIDFSSSRADEARDACRLLIDLGDDLSLNQLQVALHSSRRLTRHLHFEDGQALHSAIDVAFWNHNLFPLQGLGSCFQNDLQHLKKELTTVSKAQKPLVLTKVVEIQHCLTFLAGVQKLMSNVRQIKVLETLLHSDPVQKAVWLEMREPRIQTRQASYKINAESDRSLTSTFESTNASRPSPKIREKEIMARRQFEELESVVHKRVMLELELGQLTHEQQKKNDTLIEDRLSQVKRNCELSFSQLGTAKRLPNMKVLRPHSSATARSTGSSRPLVLNRTGVVKRGARPKLSFQRHSAANRETSLGFSSTSAKNSPLLSNMKEDKTDYAADFLNFRPSQARQALHCRRATDFGDLIDSNCRTESLLNESIDSCASVQMASHEISSDMRTPVKTDRPRLESTLLEEIAEVSDDISRVDIAGQDSTSLMTYKIPSKDFRASVMASLNSTAAYWSHTLYKGSDGKQPKVHYCTDFKSSEHYAKLFLNEPVLGFDMEWECYASLNKEPLDIKKNVSLIQLAAEDKIGLFQIARFSGDTVEELLPPTLRQILESENVIKAGVNVKGDVRRLKICMDVDVRGAFELSRLYKVVNFSASEPSKVNFALVKLAEQVHNVLHLPLKKDATRVSSWSRQLNIQQTNYAASDAYAGFQLFQKLESQRRTMAPLPPRPAFIELDQPIVLGDGTEVFKKSVPANVSSSTKRRLVENAGEGELEFFDAVEELDKPDPTSKDVSNAPTLGYTASSGIAYPTLPQVSPQAEKYLNLIDSESTSSRIPDAKEDSAKSIKANGRTFFRSETQEIRRADAWLTNWRAMHPAGSCPFARPSELRAWHLWYEQGFSVTEVAALLKQPPLTPQTVAKYILQSIKLEDLSYDAERAKAVLNTLHPAARQGFSKIRKQIEQALP